MTDITLGTSKYNSREAEPFPTDSTYIAPVTIPETVDGISLDLTQAMISVTITEVQGGDTILYQTTIDDADLNIRDIEEREVMLEIQPADVTWTGVVWEEWRIEVPADDRSAVGLQRPVEFVPVSSDATV